MRHKLTNSGLLAVTAGRISDTSLAHPKQIASHCTSMVCAIELASDVPVFNLLNVLSFFRWLIIAVHVVTR